MKFTTHLIAASALWACFGAVFAHGSGDASHDSHTSHTNHTGHTPAAQQPAQQMPFGIAGQASAVQRTITITMTDDMRFTPRHITVQHGQTVRLLVHNQGQVMHELVLGTRASLDEHEQAMRAHPGMAHDAPYMAHVAPSQGGALIWQFNRVGTFDFACLVAGHYAAGMKGRITVKPV